MSKVRLKRLAADYEQISAYTRAHARVKLMQSEGDPPERYRLEYRLNSLRSVGDELKAENTHTVEIVLPRNYPRTPPMCRMLSPVFHPNIAPHAICVGDHWSPGEPLQSIVIRIGELLAFQSYNVKSPLNGEAARWVSENEAKLPLDTVSLLPEEITPPTTQSEPETKQDLEQQKKPQQPKDSEENVTIKISDEKVISKCPDCEKKFRVDLQWMGRKTTCPKCQVEFELTPYQNA